MLKSVDTSQNTQMKEKKVANLLVSVGRLAIENYAQIILKYNDQLTSDIKRTLTLIVNNLQICSQLKSRVLRLQEKLNRQESETTESLPTYKQEKYKRLRESLTRKEEKLSQLNQENIKLLLQIGKKFNEHRLLADKDNFKELYQKITFLINQRSEIESNLQNITVDNVDLNPLNLTNLLSAKRSEV